MRAGLSSRKDQTGTKTQKSLITSQPRVEETGCRKKIRMTRRTKRAPVTGGVRQLRFPVLCGTFSDLLLSERRQRREGHLSKFRTPKRKKQAAEMASLANFRGKKELTSTLLEKHLMGYAGLLGREKASLKGRTAGRFSGKRASDDDASHVREKEGQSYKSHYGSYF